METCSNSGSLWTPLQSEAVEKHLVSILCVLSLVSLHLDESIDTHSLCSFLQRHVEGPVQQHIRPTR